MFSALGYGYNLFSFKHGPINIGLSSKIYENTSLYFIYLFIYLFHLARSLFGLLFLTNLADLCVFVWVNSRDRTYTFV